MTAKPPPKTFNLLKYHRPKLHSYRSSIPPLSKQSKQFVDVLSFRPIEPPPHTYDVITRCLQNLAAYRAPKSRLPYPRSRCAAVLVALFVGRMGDLYVLLNRRSANLRTYAGDTSLPGGRVEDSDATFEEAARREAFEEIGLPPDPRKVPLLCVTEPFLAGNDLIVTPVVVLILDNTLRPIINTTEVASLFSHPLMSLLSSVSPYPSESESTEVEYHTHYDHNSDGPNNSKWPMRMHRFLTGREAGGIKPVFGLTAAILITVARIGYAKEPDYEHSLPGAPSQEQRIAWALYSRPTFRNAFEQDCITANWDLIKKIARIEEVDDGGLRRVFDNLKGAGRRNKL